MLKGHESGFFPDWGSVDKTRCTTARSTASKCDDIFLNIIAQNKFQKPPLRVLLPQSSIVDLFDKFWPISKKLAGGLGLQRGRTPKRTECVKQLYTMHSIKHLRSNAHVSTCLSQENAPRKTDYIPRQSYKSMKATSAACSEEEDR